MASSLGGMEKYSSEVLSALLYVPGEACDILSDKRFNATEDVKGLNYRDMLF